MNTMNTTQCLIILSDIETSLLVSKAKLNLCDSENDIDNASAAHDIAFNCGMNFENMMIFSDKIRASAVATQIEDSISNIIRSCENSLRHSFESGRADVAMYAANLD